MRRFDWDPGKEAANRRRHGVTFREAATVFQFSLADSVFDDSHSIGEQRLRTTGLSALGRVLVVTTAETSTTIRIISARRATKRERNAYED